MVEKDNSTKPELLPCPFCDRPPKKTSFLDGVGELYHQVKCIDCMFETNPYQTEREAINHWNINQ